MATAQELTTRFKRRELRRKLLQGLLLTGAIYIAAGSPYFVFRLMQRLGSLSIRDIKNSFNGREKKQCYNMFSDLKRKGLVKVRYEGNNAHVWLTEKGKEQARQYQIDELSIPDTKEWDGLWRVVLFDIPEEIRIKRDVLRTKLKELQFSMIQRSSWVIPYPCRDEIKMLQEFFGFEDSHYLLIETKQLGHYEKRLRKRYSL